MSLSRWSPYASTATSTCVESVWEKALDTLLRTRAWDIGNAALNLIFGVLKLLVHQRVDAGGDVFNCRI